MQHEIHHVIQADPLGCVAACVAMVCGISYDRAVKLCGGVENGVLQPNMIVALKQAGFGAIQYVPSQLQEGRVFIIGVPSLNIVGATHAVVLDWRSENCLILDPNYGREGRLVYGYDSDLVSYYDVMEIVKGEDYAT